MLKIFKLLVHSMIAMHAQMIFKWWISKLWISSWQSVLTSWVCLGDCLFGKVNFNLTYEQKQIYEQQNHLFQQYSITVLTKIFFYVLNIMIWLHWYSDLRCIFYLYIFVEKLNVFHMVSAWSINVHFWLVNIYLNVHGHVRSLQTCCRKNMFI